MPTKTKSSKTTARTKKPIEIPRTPDLDKSGRKTARKVESNNLYPDSLFEVRDGIPQLSDKEREARVLAVKQQQNAIKVAQQNHILDREIEISQGLLLETQIQTAKNLVTAEGLNLQAVNLEIAETKTDIASEKLENLSVALQIEQVKTSITKTQLEGENINLQGEQSQLPYRQQLWDLKLENLALDVQAARSVLDNKISQLGQRLGGRA